MIKQRLPWLFLLVLFLSTTTSAAPKINDLLQTIEAQLELKTDGTCKVENTQQIAGEGVKKTEMIFYRSDTDDAFLIVMTAPEVEKGNGYLKQGNNMWMYRINTRSFQHINRDQSVAGTDAKTEDFEKRRLVDLYKPVRKSGQEVLDEVKLGDKPVYRFEIVAKTEDVAYPRRIFWVEKDTCLPLKVQSYSLNGTLMETVYYLKYTRIEGKYMWIKAMFVDEFEKGNKTIVEIKNVAVQKIDSKVFTKGYLENLSK